MELTSYVESIRQDLIAAAEVAGDDARAAAERMTASLDAAVRLALIDALSTAAEEITRELAPGSVELRMRGREPSFVVAAPPTAPPGPSGPPPPPPPPLPEGDDQGTSRITLRMMEALKSQVEAAAMAEGLSLNAYLVRAISDVIRGPQPGPAAGPQRGQRGRRGPGVGQSVSGWAR